VPSPAPLHEPEFAGNEWQYVKECIDTGWVSSVGSYVDLFEQKLSDLTGAGHAIATVNGTAALHIALILAGVEPGDEVLMPALTFVATANAAHYAGGIPHFVDVEASSFAVDAKKLDAYLAENTTQRDGACVNRASGRRIAALVCVHIFGHPADLDGLSSVCERYGLPLVEDAAESLGSTYKGKHTGTVGLVAALSFNGNKIVTSGGGGAILTNDPELAARAKHLTTTAKVPHRWEYVHDAVGFNYRLPNLNAALGCAQLERLDQFVEEKRRLADAYTEALAPIPGARTLAEPPQARSNFWLNALVLEGPLSHSRDEVLELANAAGLGARPLWTPMHELQMYASCPRENLDITSDLFAHTVNLPSSPALGRTLQSSDA
jgi:perosamine synthetase